MDCQKIGYTLFTCNLMQERKEIQRGIYHKNEYIVRGVNANQNHTRVIIKISLRKKKGKRGKKT
jgi:hypothetical protein